MLCKSFVFNCPEGATFSERSLRKSLDTSPLTLRILFAEMAAEQSASRKKGKEWLILARGASPGRNTQSECLAKQSGNLFPARGRGFYFAECGTVQCPPGADAPGQY